MKKYEVGQLVIGKVSNVRPYAVFFNFPNKNIKNYILHNFALSKLTLTSTLPNLLANSFNILFT